MGRYRIVSVYFLAVLFALSLTQIFIDAHTEVSAYADTQAEKRTYTIFIEIEDKTLYLLENGKCVKEYRVASGMSGLPSPLGCWQIIEKGDWGEGFGGRWMGLDVPWGTYGIHGTLADGSIGSAASHGCIRMFSEDVAEVYNLVPVGTDVVIVNGQFGPFGRGFAEINPGDRGSDVYAIQQRLTQLGFYKGPIDGIYEEDLKKALHKFQRAHKLKAQNTINYECWLKMDFIEFE